MLAGKSALCSHRGSENAHFLSATVESLMIHRHQVEYTEGIGILTLD